MNRFWAESSDEMVKKRLEGVIWIVQKDSVIETPITNNDTDRYGGQQWFNFTDAIDKTFYSGTPGDPLGGGLVGPNANAFPLTKTNAANLMDTDNAENLQKSASAIRAVFQARPMIPSLKATISIFYADPQWLSVRPPLLPFPEGDADKLLSDLADRDFDPSSILSI